MVDLDVFAYQEYDYDDGLLEVFSPMGDLRVDQLFLRRNSQLFVELTGKDLISVALIADGLHYHAYQKNMETPWEARNKLLWFGPKVHVLRGPSDHVLYGVSHDLVQRIVSAESDEMLINPSLFFFAETITPQEAIGFAQDVDLAYFGDTLEMRM